MSNIISAIVIDDEESARHILSNLLERVSPEIEVVSKCSNLEVGVQAIKTHKPDIVFLDIEMPDYAGYEITNFIKDIDFEIIFVTAYDHYAIKAFEISAMDYILKPIQVERLEEAIEKFKQKTSTYDAAENYQLMLETLESNAVTKLIIPTAKGQKILSLKDIISIEASGAYCTIHTVDSKTYIMSKNLKHFESLLDDNPNFIRCHKSWIVNSNYMETYSKSELVIQLSNGQQAKLSKYKKAKFEELIAQ